MTADCIIEDPQWDAIDLPDIAATATSAALAHLGLDPDQFETCILACDAQRIAVLNADFRDKPTATNVLSWPTVDLRPDRPGLLPQAPAPTLSELGDIAIAFEVCEKEAVDAGKPLTDHVTHLVVHATLHLLGYDHVNDEDAALMEQRETEILGNLGLPDPYSP